MLDPWALRNSWLKKRLAHHLYEWANLRAAACLHALNDEEALSIRRYGLTNPIAVIPNGVGLPDLRASDGNDAAPVLGADPRKPLLFLGRLHPKKGLVETIHAWKLVRDRSPEVAAQWRLVITGWDDGGHLPGLKALAVELGLAEDVSFQGPLFGAAKEAAFRAAGAFVLASYSEGLPNAVLEAWSHGLPVFMTEACNLPDGFVAGAAIAIDTAPDRLALVLSEHLARSDLGAVGQRGRELVELRYNWDRVARDLAAVYAWLVSGAPRPDTVRLE
jgi:poly(glycerol-phosphate) alpha-glucosyltransferase